MLAKFCALRPRNLLVTGVVLWMAGSLNLLSYAGAPPDMEKLLKTGYADLGQGRSDEALKFFQDKAKKYPNSGAVHVGIGKALKRLGKLSEAKAEFRKATEVESTFAVGFYELGCCLESDKEWGGAADAFQKYLDLNPDAGERRAISDRIRYCQSQKS